MLTPSTAEDKDVIVCTAEAAEEYCLTNLTELGEASGHHHRRPAGVRDPLAVRPRRFKEIYGAEFKEFVPLAVGAVADALSAGADRLRQPVLDHAGHHDRGFVALEDDKGTVPNEAVLPLVRTEVVTPELEATLDDINQELDTDVLKELMVKVEVDAAAPDVVAKEWLASLG